ncbi:hypothetical protein V9L05_11105 [Bernardetia sp. Wsw4-3y2]|uniref:hypothetical protein n=1 Tax=Bernardetia sp. Wsw4-3y2 TaxID=3127471 RepID=UPI0030CE62CF
MKIQIVFVLLVLVLGCSNDQNKEQNDYRKKIEISLSNNIDNLFLGSSFNIKSKIKILQDTILQIGLESSPNDYIVNSNFRSFISSYIVYLISDTTTQYKRFEIDFFLDGGRNTAGKTRNVYTQNHIEYIKDDYERCIFLKRIISYAIERFDEGNVSIYNSHLESLNAIADQKLETDFFSLIIILCSKKKYSLESDNLRLLYTMISATIDMKGEQYSAVTKLKKCREQIKDIYELV